MLQLATFTEDSTKKKAVGEFPDLAKLFSILAEGSKLKTLAESLNEDENVDEHDLDDVGSFLTKIASAIGIPIPHVPNLSRLSEEEFNKLIHHAEDLERKSNDVMEKLIRNIGIFKN